MLGNGGIIYFLLDYMSEGKLGFPMLGEHDGIVSTRR